MQYYKFKDIRTGHWIGPNDVRVGNIVTLKDGRRGKVRTKGRWGFSMMNGKRGNLVDFYSGVVAKIERRRISRVCIYQIDPLDSEYAFRDYANVKAKGRSAPPPELYKVAFDGQLDTDNLEEIFRIFNINHPQDYRNRSLSMSDIVELYDAGGSRFFYCDTVGFRKIRFKPVEFLYMLLTRNERNLLTPQVFGTLGEAQRRMKNELLEQLDGSFKNYDENEDYGICDYSAWSNPGSNWDWDIIRLSVNKAQSVKAAFIPGESSKSKKEPEPDNIDGGYPCCLHDTERTLDWCESNCGKDYSCDTVAMAIDESKIRDGE